MLRQEKLGHKQGTLHHHRIIGECRAYWLNWSQWKRINRKAVSLLFLSTVLLSVISGHTIGKQTHRAISMSVVYDEFPQLLASHKTV
jgi:hypothetical protein